MTEINAGDVRSLIQHLDANGVPSVKNTGGGEVERLTLLERVMLLVTGNYPKELSIGRFKPKPPQGRVLGEHETP